MNVLLWTLQVLLALWNFMGGFYMVQNYEKLTAGMTDALPQPLWTAHGVLQILLALGLILPPSWVSPKAAPMAALGLAALLFFDAAWPLNDQYAGFPGMLWPLIPALLAGSVAYGRMERKPS